MLKKNNKNCMILHCKIAEIVISAFLQCKIIQFLLIFFPIQICFRLNKKNFLVIFIFIFFPPPTLIFKKKSVNQVLKKITLLLLDQPDKQLDPGVFFLAVQICEVWCNLT